MKDNASYQQERLTGAQLPLDDFFTALQRGGIGVTPAQIAEANKLVLQYAPSVQDEAALCKYLCPLFATNQAEQERFKEIFAEQFAHKENPLPPPEPPPKKHGWKYVLALLIATFVIVGILRIRPSVPQSPDVRLTYKTTGQYSGDNDNTDKKRFVSGDTLQVKVKPVSNSGIDTHLVQLKAVYYWGDNAQADTTGRHVYSRSGLYTSKVLVDIFYKGEWLRKDTNETTLTVCDFDIGLAITTTAVNDSIALGDTASFRINFDSPQAPYQIVWTVQGDADTGQAPQYSGSYPQKKEQSFAPTSEGSYMVSCELQYDSVGSICTYEASRLVYAYDPQKPQANAVLQASPQAKPLIPKYRVKLYWFFLFGGGLIGFILLRSLFRRLYNRLRRAQEEAPLDDAAYQQWLASFASTQPPADLPFLNKNQNAPPEQEMLNIGRMMRRRIEGEALFMHIGKTIGKAVRNSGFFQPVMAPRTHQGEYLLLVEESHINSQQTKLFDYLAETLRRYNVFVEKYHYRYEPSLCYNAATPNGISLDKLSEKYPNHVLVIAGHCHQLTYPYQPMVSNSYQKILSRWSYKAILTPLSYPDWGQVEKSILPTVIPVFPADVFGHLLMMQALADNRIDVQQGLQEQASQCYAAAELDAEDIAELTAYCELAEWARSNDGNPYNNLLFQWIAALAVYPKLQWELVLGIGKAILDTAGQGHQLNFTSLLRLVRLKWMQEGIMPPELRLELLKKLNRSNEVLARETILAALNEIPANDIRPGHAAYEEMETQRIINEFNLYAYDPIKYALYARSKTIFERLWKDKKVMEAAVKKYLRNENAQWPTLINSRLAENPEGAASIPVEDYFRPLPPAAKGLAKLYASLGMLCTILVGICTLGLLGMIALSFTDTKRFPLFTKQKKQWHPVNFSIIDSTARDTTSNQRLAKEVLLAIDTNTASFNLASFDVSSKGLQLPFNENPQPITITVNNKPALDTTMFIDKDNYRIILKDKAKEVPLTRVVFNLGPDCGDNLQTMSRYQLMAESATEGIKAIMGNASGKRNKTGACVNAILVGNGVDAQMVRKLIERFKQNKIELAKKSVSDYGVPDGEIVITSLGEDSIPQANIEPTPIKPIIYLQVSDAGLLASAETFRKRLVAKEYTVRKAEIMDWSYDSEIYYFDKSMEQPAQTIAALYQSFYPMRRPVKPKMRKVNDPRSKDNRIVVWMKKLEPSPPVPVPDKQQPEKQQDDENNWGDRILGIAGKEIGTGENPPGSNKTKYGEWYDYKLNAYEGIAWSALFVSWVYKQAGAPIGNDGRGFVSFEKMLKYCQQKNLLVSEPLPGDIFIMAIDNADEAKGAKTATPITERYTGGIFQGWTRSPNRFSTIEGNISIGGDAKGTVGRGTRSSKDQKVYFIHFQPPIKKGAP